MVHWDAFRISQLSPGLGTTNTEPRKCRVWKCFGQRAHSSLTQCLWTATGFNCLVQLGSTGSVAAFPALFHWSCSRDVSIASEVQELVSHREKCISSMWDPALSCSGGLLAVTCLTLGISHPEQNCHKTCMLSHTHAFPMEMSRGKDFPLKLKAMLFFPGSEPMTFCSRNLQEILWVTPGSTSSPLTLQP